MGMFFLSAKLSNLSDQVSSYLDTFSEKYFVSKYVFKINKFVSRYIFKEKYLNSRTGLQFISNSHQHVDLLWPSIKTLLHCSTVSYSFSLVGKLLLNQH